MEFPSISIEVFAIDFISSFVSKNNFDLIKQCTTFKSRFKDHIPTQKYHFLIR